jgi:hypothetical protein
MLWSFTWRARPTPGLWNFYRIAKGVLTRSFSKRPDLAREGDFVHDM